MSGRAACRGVVVVSVVTVRVGAGSAEEVGDEWELA